MKKLLVIAIVLTVVGSAFATINIDWYWDYDAGAAIVQSDGVTFLPSNSIVQLIWTSDTVLDALNPANPLTPTGNDTLLATAGSDSVAFFNFGVSQYGSVGDPEGYVGGYVGVRIFDVDMSATPTVGDYYLDGIINTNLWGGPILDGDLIPPPIATPAVLGASGGVTPFVVNQQIIPEPATLMFAFAGAGLIAYRRLKAKK